MTLERLAGDVALAGRDLEQLGVERGPVLAHQGDGAVVVERHDRHRAGMADDLALEGRAVGPLEGADGQADDVARWTTASPRWRNPPVPRVGHAVRVAWLRRGGRLDVEVEQVRVAALGPGQRGADELAEQRRRALGPALELGVGLGADPERVALELDELDEAAVGRGARAARSRCPRSGRGTWG